MDVQIKWKNGEVTWEPVEIIKKDDPISLAEYAHDKELLHQSSWKWCRRFLYCGKLINVLQANAILNKKALPRLKFGYKVPRNISEALKIDRANRNTAWHDTIRKEIYGQVHEHKVSEVKKTSTEIPTNYQYIPLLWVFDIKYDGRHRAQMVTGGHRVTIRDHEDSHSNNTSMEEIRLIFVIAILLGLSVITCYIRHAYLQAFTRELVYTRAGPEFENLAGSYLIIVKALYRLPMSSARWHDELSDTLHAMGFHKSKAGIDIWICQGQISKCIDIIL